MKAEGRRTKDEWKTVTLGGVFDIARGGSPRPIDKFITDDADGVNWIMISDATSKYITSTKKRIIKEGMKKSREVHPGDFLLTNSMSFGRPYIMQTSGCIHDGWLVLSPRGGVAHPDYFYHLLGSDVLYAEFERRAAGATVKNLNIDLVKGVEVLLPPLAEQRRIAEVLDRAEALRAKRRAALAQLDSLTQSLFLDLFGDPATNPKGWPKKPLASLVRDDDTINYGVVQPGDNLDEGVPLVRVGDLIEGKVRHSELKRIAPSIEAAYKRSRLRGDEILVSCVGSIGVVALANESVKGFNIARAVARIPLAETTCRLFMAAYLSTDFVQRYFTNELRTVSQPTLNIKQISETTVVLPPHPIAARIRPASDGGGGAEDGAARVAGGAGRALRHSPAPRLPRGIMTTPPLRPKGPPSLSPGHRPGSAGRIVRRPVGPRYGRRNAPAYRAPLGRTNRLVSRDPARWAGLRNRGPLARTATRVPLFPSANGVPSLSPGQRPGYASPQTTCGL